MTIPRKAKYKDLGDLLLLTLTNDRSQRWLAARTFVSREAVHFWLSGESRPDPHRLGQIAAILNLEPQRLASLAKYDDNPNALQKILLSYDQWRPLDGRSLSIETKQPKNRTHRQNEYPQHAPFSPRNIAMPNLEFSPDRVLRRSTVVMAGFLFFLIVAPDLFFPLVGFLVMSLLFVFIS